MTLRLLSFVLIVALIGAPDAAAADTIRVYLVGGQSNADGRAPVSNLPPALRKPQDDVLFYFHTERGRHKLDRRWTTLRPGVSESHNFGPEITFGRAIADRLADDHTRIALIKYANGGTNLHTQWAAGGDASQRGDGPECRTFQQTVRDALAALAEAHPTDRIRIAGMIWMQGEADTHDPDGAADYAENLARFIADVRATFAADLPFVVGRLSRHQTRLKPDRVAMIRRAQSRVAADDDRAGLVDTDDFPLNSDHLHYNAAGQRRLGEAFAATLRTLPPPPPRP